MIGSEVKRFESLKKLVILLRHLFVVLQVAILVMVSLCILYVIFAYVFNSEALNFLNPFINGVIDFIASVFGNSIKESQDGIDGRVVLFILLGIVAVVFIIQLRMACDSGVKVVEKKITEARLKEENVKNKKLQDDMHNNIVSQNHYLIAAQIRVKSLFKESLTSESYSDEELANFKKDASSKFLSKVRALAGITLTEDEDYILISSNSLNNLDYVVTYLWKISEELKAEFRTKKVGFRAKLAVDCYRAGKSTKVVFEMIKPLLDLNANNEVLCFGNFKNRYDMIQNTQYMVVVKGKYELKDGGEDTVWSLVKKD